MSTISNTLNKQVFKNILEFYKTNDKTAWSTKDYSYQKTLRALGVMEGILLSYGIFTPGSDFDFKMVEADEYGWFGRKRRVIRKQTYAEYIVELFEELINKTEE